MTFKTQKIKLTFAALTVGLAVCESSLAQSEVVQASHYITVESGQIQYSLWGKTESSNVTSDTLYTLNASSSNVIHSGTLTLNGQLSSDALMKIINASGKAASDVLFKGGKTISGNKAEVSNIFVAQRYGQVAGLLAQWDNANPYKGYFASGRDNSLVASGDIVVSGAAHLAGAKFNFLANQTEGATDNNQDFVNTSLEGNTATLKNASLSFEAVSEGAPYFSDLFGASVSIERYGVNGLDKNKTSAVTISGNEAHIEKVHVGGKAALADDALRAAGGALWLTKDQLNADINVSDNSVTASKVSRAQSEDGTGPSAFVSLFGSLIVGDELAGDYHLNLTGNTVSVEDSELDLISGSQVSLTNTKENSSFTLRQGGNTVIMTGHNRVSQGIFGSMYKIDGAGTLNMDNVQPRANLEDGLWRADSLNNALIIKGIVKTGGVAGFDRLILNPTMENTTLDKAMLTIEGRTSEDQIDPAFSPVVDFSGSAIDIFVAVPNDVAAANQDTLLYLIHASDADKGVLNLQGATIKAKHTFFDQTWSNVDVEKDKRIVGLALKLNGELVLQPIEPEKPEEPGNPEPPTEDEIVIAPSEVKPNENANTLTGTALGNLAFVNQGADFVRDAAMYAAEEVVLTGKPSLWASSKAEHARYRTNPDFTTNGVNFAFGLTYKVRDTVLLGFLEAGRGNTKTHIPNTSAKSKQNYLGAGVAFRTKFESGLFVDGIFRAGSFKTKFNGSYDVGTADYKARLGYLSAEGGVGYTMPLRENLDLVPYAMYRYSHLPGKTVDLKGSEKSKIKLGKTDSHETRIGADFVGKVGKNTNLRAGAAWSHVYGGKVNVNVAKLPLDEVSLKGNSAIGSLGIDGKFSENSNWRYQVKVKGFLGDKKGVSGSGLIQYIF